MAAALLACLVIGCGGPGRACRNPILLAVVPTQGNPWWLSYDRSWQGGEVAVSADGRLTAGDQLSFPDLVDTMPPPEAMVAVGDRALVAAGGQAYVLSRAGEALTAQQVGTCPQAVRQMIVIPAAASSDAVSLAILAGGEYEDRRLKRADIFLATLEGEQLQVVPSGYNRSWHPWRLQAGKMSGHAVLFVGAMKAAHFDDRERNRPQLFEVLLTAAPLMRPMWLGTSLSRPFEDTVLVDFDGDGEHELAAVEWTSEGNFLVQVYAWRGSGFEGSGTVPRIYHAPPEIAAAALNRGDPHESLLVHCGDMLVAHDLEETNGRPQFVARLSAPVESGVTWRIIPGSGDIPPTVLSSGGDLVPLRSSTTTLLPASAQTP